MQLERIQRSQGYIEMSETALANEGSQLNGELAETKAHASEFELSMTSYKDRTEEEQSLADHREATLKIHNGDLHKQMEVLQGQLQRLQLERTGGAQCEEGPEDLESLFMAYRLGTNAEVEESGWLGRIRYVPDAPTTPSENPIIPNDPIVVYIAMQRPPHVARQEAQRWQGMCYEERAERQVELHGTALSADGAALGGGVVSFA